jgi:hypothetical protein
MGIEEVNRQLQEKEIGFRIERQFGRCRAQLNLLQEGFNSQKVPISKFPMSPRSKIHIKIARVKTVNT